VVLHQCQEDDVGLLDGQRSVNMIGKGLHGPAYRRRPHTVDFALIAADALELQLNFSCEPEASL
jgi:hypothetical protein